MAMQVPVAAARSAGTAVWPRVELSRVVGPPTEENIRRRAYERYLERGCAPGDPVQDWLQAEWELKLGRR